MAFNQSFSAMLSYGWGYKYAIIKKISALPPATEAAIGESSACCH
jgi:serine protease inhibitor ecotin